MPSSSKQPSSSTSKSTSASGQSGKGAGSQGGTGVSPNFAQSYGLKFHDPKDYAEAQAIQQAFRDQDAKQGGR
ncbi:hypothetical protein HO173_006505 [Letharia columbiana]|uniref:Uncharacterized protein n=1 Tax=Letharia columbiana TaxID=112416 RepID=A0A8H6FV62_9LECA|nr:uncharacterized protein HO173_006505 [Letharia columbiana]KAF6235309.1 hypothetical protein HO173_006505 [Letharia columbiana]